MSPKVLQEGDLIFWFHSYDARYEERASVHVGKGSQDDYNDAKICGARNRSGQAWPHAEAPRVEPGTQGHRAESRLLAGGMAWL